MSFLPDAPSGMRSRAAGPVTGGPVHVDQLQCDCRRHPPPSQPRLRTAVRCSCRPRWRPTLVRLSKRSAAASGRAFREPSCFRPRQPSTAADHCASVHVAPKMPRSAFSATVLNRFPTDGNPSQCRERCGASFTATSTPFHEGRATLLQIAGLTPAQGNRYQRQRRRCHLCGQVFTAKVRQAQAPVDNNLCEGALKKGLLHPQNAMFSK